MEAVVTVAIIAVLSAIVVFSVAQYIAKGKNAKISGNLSILSTAGEAYYDGNGRSYEGFCGSSVVANASQDLSSISAGFQCEESSGNQAWLACAKDFVTAANVYCVDSRGPIKNIVGTCENIISSCGSAICKCP